MSGHPISEATRAKISAANKGCTAWNKGKPMSEACRATFVSWNKGVHTGQPAWNKGIPMTDEQKARLLAANMGRVPWNKGIPMNVETRAKLSVAHTGFIESLEHRAKISAALKGKPVSEVCKMAALSLEARVKRSAAQTGPLNWGWKGGITPENKRIRESLEYMAWRTAVFERDHYTCQDCGVHSGMGHTVKLEGHHIHEFAQYPDERFVVDNGKTLCSDCHNKTKGRKAQVAA